MMVNKADLSWGIFLENYQAPYYLVKITRRSNN
ncbi:hypothetical protein IGI92_002549 [Enterococcus sp. DIV2379]